MPLKPYLQLVRLPNLFTAAADSLAGWLLAGGSLNAVGGWLPLCGASMAIYAGGVALNDVCDAEVDRLERPRRPIPSGQVTRKFAAGLAVGLFALGLALAALSLSASTVAVAAALVSCVVAYDALLKHTPFGPLAMGACRSANLLLGLSHAPALGGPFAWLAAAALGLFVAGITLVSRSEAGSASKRGILAGIFAENAGVLGLLAAALVGPWPAASAEARAMVPIEGLLVLLGVLLIVDLAGSKALRNPEPRLVQSAVKTAVLSLVWLDVGLVAAVRGPMLALAVAALWVPAYLLARWLYAT